MSKSPRNHQGKVKRGFWLLNPASNSESVLLSLFFLLLPTQLGKHFWPDFSFVAGIRIDYLSPTLYVTDVLLLLLFGCFLLRTVKSFKKPKSIKSTIQKYRKNIFYISLVLLFFIINISMANPVLLSVYGFIKLCEFSFLALYIAKTISSRNQLVVLSIFFALGVLFESVLAVLQYLQQGSLNGIFYFFGERNFTGTTPGIANASINGTLILRPYATFPHPNVLAAYLLVAMSFVWNFVLKNKHIALQVLGAVSLFIGSIALLLTFSRVVIILWIILAAAVLIKSTVKKVGTTRAKLFAILTVCVCGMILFLLPVTHEVFNRLWQTSLTDESVTERIELLTASEKMIQAHPLFGVGLYNFIPSLAPLQKPMPLGLYLQPVHNIFVLVLAESGIIGLVLFVWLCVATGMQIKKQRKEIKVILGILVLIIISTGMFDHYWLTLQQGQLLFAIIIGFCWTKDIDLKQPLIHS